MTKRNKYFKVLCVDNKPYLTGEGFVETDIPLGNLTLGKVYSAKEWDEKEGWLVVIDDYEEVYAYPRRMFWVIPEESE